MRYFIELSYNGSVFHGWQTQPNAITVQEKIEEALKFFFGSECPVVGCGRTDTGVHAHHYYAHFNMETDFSVNQLTYKLNRILPNEIAIHRVFEVKDDLHARFSAQSRMYRYFISLKKDPFSLNSAWQFYRDIDFEAMQEVAPKFIGKHDFSSFAKAHSDVKTTDCVVSRSEWEREGDLLIYNVVADRFLRNMVRALVGTQIEVGLGKRDLKNVEQLLKGGSRSDAGQSVPAHGLYLWNISYEF